MKSFCITCHESCKKCTDTTKTGCTECSSGLYLLASNNSCIACNSGSYVPEGQYCVPCDSSCKSCSVGNSPTNCTSCFNGRYLYEGNNTCLQGLNVELAAAMTTGSKTGSTAALAVSNAISGKFSISLMLVLTVVDAIANQQYLNMNHSQTASNLYPLLSTELLPNWISQIKHEEAVSYWGIFKTRQTSSLYLDNLGDTFEVLSIHMLLTLLTLAISYLFRSSQRFGWLFFKMHVYFFGLLGSNIFGKIQSHILFSILQAFEITVFTNTYHGTSVVLGYLATSSIIGFITYTFLKSVTIYNSQKKIQEKESNEFRQLHRRKTLQQSEDIEQYEKYSFIYDDFKMKSKNTFLFNYWTMTYNSAYILLILSLQSNAIVQCSSIVILTIIFIIFSAVLRPFKEISSAILHFFNLSCILAVSIANLSLIIALKVTPAFEGAETQGLAIFVVVMINFCVNTIIPVYLIVRTVYRMCKKKKAPNSSRNHRLSVLYPRRHHLIDSQVRFNSSRALQGIQPLSSIVRNHNESNSSIMSRSYSPHHHLRLNNYGLPERFDRSQLPRK